MSEINRALSIRGWKNLHKFFSYFDKVIDRMPDGAYKKILNEIVEQSAEKELRTYHDAKSTPQDKKDEVERWFGFPVPTDMEDLRQRRTYQNMALYDKTHAALQPYLDALAKNSAINIPMPKVKPNDRELGMFSFERAMMSPKAIIGYYSIKHKKFVPVSEIEKEKKGNGYVLKADGSKVEIRQAEHDNGKKKIGTENKSSFLYKAPIIKPHKAIQLFVNIGVNCNHPAFWAGVTGMAIAKYLESRGYAVGVTMVVGISSNWMGAMRYQGEMQKEMHTRYLMVELKEIGGGYDTLTMLYVLADGSFFRYKIFRAIVAQQYEFEDAPNSSLGSAVELRILEEDISLAIKRRDWEIAQNALEFYLGGDDLVSEQHAKDTIERIIIQCEARNLLVLAAIQPEMLPALEAALAEAEAAGRETFMFHNTQVGVVTARAMIDHLTQRESV